MPIDDQKPATPNPFDKFDGPPVAGVQPGANPFDKFEDPNYVPTRGAFAEIGNQLKAGVLADLPKMAGQAIQYTSDPGKPVYDFGKTIADYGRAQEERPDLKPQEDRHNAVTNMFASGARMIPQSIVPAAAVGAGLAMASPLGRAANLAIGSVAGAMPAGMSQAEDTLEKAREKGIPEDQALAAARQTGLIEWGGETLGNYTAGKLFGLGSRALGKSVGNAAEDALAKQTSTQVLKPFLKQLPQTMATEVGTEMGQNAGEAAVEQAYGIDNQDPWQQAKEAIGPTIGMTLLLAPFGLGGHYVASQQQAKRNDALTNSETDPEQRMAIASQIAPEIDAVDPQAGANFRANVARAVNQKAPLTLDGTLFADPAAAPVPPEPITAAAANTAAPLAAPTGPLSAAAAKVAPGLFPFGDANGAQKQADAFANETGIAHEVVPHPTVAGKFAAVPAKENSNGDMGTDVRGADLGPAGRDGEAGLDQPAGTGAVGEQGPGAGPGAGPGVQDAAGQAGVGQPDTAPVAFKKGDTVHVTENGEDLFPKGTRIIDLSDDGQMALVEGGTAPVPVDRLTRYDGAAAAAFDERAHGGASSPTNDLIEPTDAMKEAGNYKKGHATLQGLDLSIENPVGSMRSGVDRDGTPWETTMNHHYGYIRGTNGADNEHIDAYVGPNPQSHRVFVVDQTNPQTGEFDEHKVMLGFNSQEQARKAYDIHYAPDWQGGASMHATTIDGLKEWMKGDTTLPFGPAPAVKQSLTDAPAAPTGATTPAVPETTQPAALPAWHDSPFAPRIQSLLDQLTAAGDPDYAKAIAGGFAMDARHDKLDEEKTAFREENVRQRLATLANQGQVAKPVDIEPETYDSLAAKINTIKALPRPIGEAAVARWNEIAPQLAALGFKDGEVDARHSPEAQALQKQLKAISNALDGLAPRRYQQAKGHKNLNPDAVERNEDTASEVLGIDTRAHPGVDASKQITLGQGVKNPTGTTTPADPARATDDAVQQVAAGEKVTVGDTAVWIEQGDAGWALKTKIGKGLVKSAVPGTGAATKERAVEMAREFIAMKNGGLVEAQTEQAEQVEPAEQAEQAEPTAFEKYKEQIAKGGGTQALADQIRRDEALTDEQVRELVGEPKIDTKAEAASIAASVAFGERAAEILALAKAMKSPAEVKATKDALTKLADDMDAVNDRFKDLVRQAVTDVGAYRAVNMGKATPEQKRDASRVKNTLDGVINFGKNVTAPEHGANKFKPLDPDNKFTPAATGASQQEGAISNEASVPLDMNAADFKQITDEWAELFEAPEKKVITDQRAKAAGFISQAEADARLQEWKDHVDAQAEEHGADNSTRTILSLFDLSGEWSKPWAEAGYNVVMFDIQSGQDVNDFNVEYFTENYDLSDVYGILAAAPCTDFSSAASRLFAVKNADGRTEASKELVLQTLRTIEYFRPKFWALENPVGRIESVTGLPQPRMSFQPHHFGNPNTKPTALYGKFNPELPLANVEPVDGSKTDKVGGRSIETKNERSETPEGFAYAFFMANNYVDLTPEQRLTGDYPEASGAIKAALKAGVSEDRVRELMHDTYENGEEEEARDALVEEVAALKNGTGDYAAEDHADQNAAADAEREAAAAAAGPKPATVGNPLKFYSGMSRPGDFTKLFAEHRNVGITVGELSKVSTPKIAAAMADSNAHLFVDSGAFPIYKRNERAFLNALSKDSVDEIKGEEVLSFDQIIERYEAIQKAINDADESGEAVERAFFVMPDVVGRQDESLRLVGQYAGKIKDFGVQNAIVPLQAGEQTLTQAYESMMLELALDPDHDTSPILGIPSAVEAVSNEQLKELLDKHGGNIFGLHILGAVSDQRLAPRLEVIREAGFDGHVSADANRLRSLMYGDTTRDEAWAALMAESEPAKGRIETEQPAPALGKEVSRFAGKDGKGLSYVKARMAAGNRRSGDAAHDYTVEPSTAHPGMYEVVGREKSAAAPAEEKPGLKKMQDAKTEKDAAKAGAPASKSELATQTRSKIDAILDANTLLVAQANLKQNGNRFADFLAEYKEAFKGALAGMLDTIGDTAYAQFSNRIEKLPGYLSHAARKFIETHSAKDGAAVATPAPAPAKAPADQQAATERRAQRQAYQMVGTFPSVLAAAKGTPAEFTAHATEVLADWIKGERSAAAGDAARLAELDSLMADGKPTMPQEFFESLQKYAQRNAREAAKAAARNPETYKQGLLDATIAAALPVDADQVALFKAGFDHALAGKTKSTLLPGELLAKGYEAGQKWIKTDVGAAYYSGKVVKKLENTGEDLRRWFDKAASTIKDASPDNLTAAWDTIKAQASRADAFANLAGNDATPGTTRYLNDLRDIIIPFQEWLMNDGALSRLLGFYKSNMTPSEKVAAFLSGDMYVSDHWVPGYAGKDATPAERLALIQREANKYMNMLRTLTGALQGAKTVADAAARFTKLTVAKADEYRGGDLRATAEGKAIQEFFRYAKGYRFETGTHYVDQTIKNEATPDDPNQHKKPLVAPKLDRVARENLPDYRKGKDVTPKQFKAKFGLADVGFGEYVAAKQGQDHLNYAYDAFMDLSKFLGIPSEAIGLGGKLHFTIGALGHGKHAAHFTYGQPDSTGKRVTVINLTNTRGDGTVAHEWFHALDHALNTGYRVNDGAETWIQHPAIAKVLGVLTRHYDLAYAKAQVLDFLKGDLVLGKKTVNRSNDARRIANAIDGIDHYTNRGRTTDYKKSADKLGEDYWGNPRELIARAAEAYVHDRMEGMNNYLVNPAWVAEGKIAPPTYKGTPYPLGEERQRFHQAFDALVKSLRFSKDGVTVDAAAFNAAMPNTREDYNAGLAAMQPELPALLAQQRLEERARKERIAERQAAEAKAQEETLRIAYEARMRAELEAEGAVAKAKASSAPLTDAELDELLDAAEAELAEENANEPAAKEPGETAAAPAPTWSREDYQFIRDKVEQGEHVIFGNEKWATDAGLPTIGDWQNMLGTLVKHMGYGVFEVTNNSYAGNFTAGGSMSQTPGGQSYTTFSTTRGEFAYPKAEVLKALNAKLIVKAGPKAAPVLQTQQDKKAATLIAEAAKMGVKGIDEALKGLAALFGAGPGKLQSFPSGFDEDAYKQAKPHFMASLKAFQEAGKTLQDLFKLLFAQLGAGVRPYAKQFAKEMALDRDLGAAPVATENDGATVVTAPIQAHTEQKEQDDDSTSVGNAQELDPPLVAGPAAGAVRPTEPIRGAGLDDLADRPADDGRLRGLGDGDRDAAGSRGDVGDAGGDAGVSHGAPDAVGGNPGTLPARDFRAGVADLERTGSWRDSAARNVDLIELARRIEAENRPATPEEQAQLARYVGFGAGEIRNKLFPIPNQYAKQKDPTRLIWPSEIPDPVWRGLAERLAALPREWQQSVLQSTQYAHYTSAPVVNAIWSAVEHMGFTGGKIMEPGMGIGSFPMLMPDGVRASSKYTGIEFDGPTALIAKLLSPQQNTLHDDFIKRRLPKDYFDLAIGNPPFAKTKVVADPEYAKHNFALHDYFFAKSIDRVRPGGLLVFVTSHYTMDKAGDKARTYLADRADLLGAIRLPQTAFQDNAGTTVVTDVLFLRKREAGAERAGVDWKTLDTLKTKDGDVLVNRYFVEHPDMILGQSRLSGNTDDMGRRINGLRGLGEYTVVSYDRDSAALEEKFAAAVKQLPANAYSVMTAPAATIKAETAKVDFDPSVKREGVLYLAKDGTVMRVEQGVGKALVDVTTAKLSAKDLTWLKGFVGLRNLVREAQAAQHADAGWEKALKSLNTAYDKFRKAHGAIRDFTVSTRTVVDEDGFESQVETRRQKNRRLYAEDYDASIVTQLEHIKEDGTIIKAPFLLGRTIGKPVVRDVKTIGDALAVSLDERGSFDIDDVARRIGLSREEALEALGTQVYENPQGELELADAYLSGDVVAKLEEARLAAHDNPALERNIAALVAVQPVRLGPSQITVKLGASWVPSQHVNAFAYHIGAGAVEFDRKTESWQVEGGNKQQNRSAANDYGTAARSPSELLEAVLNSRTIVIKYGASAGKELVGKTDPEATTAANEVAKKIRDEFKSWVWQDSERATELVDIYNTIANNLAPRRFNGDHLTLPGVSMRYKLFSHQKQAIWRVIQTGDTYLAHAVGAGKTIEMVAAAMEQKRLGLIKKPMFVVPNHMLDQFANEFMELYPLANIMVADDQNFKAERRRAFIAAATLNAPDAVIITHSAFKLIGVKEESVAPIRDQMIADLESDLAEVGKDQRVRRSQLEQQIEAIKQRFDKVLGMGGKDNSITFEDIGADQLIVDEAHAFRKLDFATNQQIKGIDPNGSQAALGLYVKTRYLQSINPGRAMVFASGTPVTNTMGELYTVMRFFAPKVMEEMGISTFDGWARMFGEVATALEPNATGRYENVERFSKFSNIPELMSRVRQFMDVLTSEHLGALVTRPDIEGGKPELIVVPASNALKRYMETVLTPRLTASRKWKPSPNEPHNPDPVLNIITDGKFAALDPRFFGGAIGAGESSKLNRMAEEIVKEYHATKDETFVDDLKAATPKQDALKGGTQIVFYNLGFGASAKVNRGFDARATLTKMLTAGGVKREHIAFFDDADTDAKKEAVFKAMRAGQLRILVGSAKKMGTGVNVQKRLSALHYFDPPWYPSDIEQPHGRIIRQGNQHDNVRIKWYSTKGTYDETMWQMVARKQRFIDQAFSGDASIRSMDDLSEASLFEQAAAMSSGDPRAIQLAGLRQDVERLERLQAAHSNEQVNLREELRRVGWTKEWAEKDQKTLAAAFKALGEQHVSFTDGKVDGKSYDTATDFGDALRESFNDHMDQAIANMGRPIDPIAKLPGIELTLTAQLDSKNRPTGTVALEATVGPKTVEMFRSDKMASPESVSGVGLTRSIYTMANGISRELDKTREVIAQSETKIIRLSKKVGAPFAQMGEMVEKNRELLQLEDELRADGKQQNMPVVNINADGDITLDGEAPPRSLLPGTSGDPGRLQRRSEDRARRAADPMPDVKLSRGVAGPGLPTAAVQQVVDRVAAGWAKAPPVTVVANVAGLPFSAPGDTRGALQKGRVYLVAANLHSLEEAQFVLGHEALGHLGLRSIMALPQLGAEMARLREANPSLAAAAREQVRLHGYDLNLATEEALADIAGSGAQITGWQKFIAAVQQALRKVGLHRLADWIEGKTAAETMALLGRARAAVERGDTAPAGTAAAQLSDAGGGHWYSTLARQIEKTVTKTASPLHWGETIMGTSFAQKGVKQDEIQWSGVLDWLNMQKDAGVAKVSREQVLNYLAENGVQVSETTLGEPAPPSNEGLALRKAVFDQYQERIDDARARSESYKLPVSEQEEALDEMEELMTERDRAADAAYRLPADLTPSAEYGNWQLPGGENYRELLLTLPQKDVTTHDFVTLDAKGEPFGVHATELEARRIANQIGGTYEAGESIGREPVKFQSGHWKQAPNVLAHVRFNERTDVDGQRVLFVEEMQSDWGAVGRRDGFAGPAATAEEKEAAKVAVRAADDAMEAANSLYHKYERDVQYWDGKMAKLDADPRTPNADKSSAVAAYMNAIQQRNAQAVAVSEAKDAFETAVGAKLALVSKGKGIARAPFVEKTEAWVSLAVKRMIRYAAQNGFDKVAFINGDQSADRYDLSKHVVSVTVARTPDGFGKGKLRVSAYDDAATRVVERFVDTFDQVAEVIGKELAAKAQEELKQKDQAVFAADDLKIGGEGMRTFYDKIVPNVVNDVLKKLGGGKVGTVSIPVDRYKGYVEYEVGPGMAGLPGALAVHGVTPTGERIILDQNGNIPAKVAKLNADKNGVAQPGFAITDALREKAAGGMPMFARGDQDVAGWTGARIDHLLSAYAYTNSDGKTKAYAAWITPQDYLALTTENQSRIAAEAKPLDRAMLTNQTQEIFLQVDGLAHGATQVTGHEGRHRAYALMQSGVTKFPVVVYSSQGAKLPARAQLKLDGQDFGFARAPGRAVTLTNAVPITYDNRQLIADTFGQARGSAPLFSRAPALESAAFKEWFGKSRVTDMNEQPKVVYHGTGADFSAFELAKLGNHHDIHHGSAALGFFFSQAPELPNKFAGPNGNVMPVYLSIKNPYYLTVTEAGSMLTREDAEAFRTKLQRQGYDGVRVARGGIWVAFSPNQIKSAVGNNGQYARDNDDILFSRSAGDISRQVGGTIKKMTYTSVKNKFTDHRDKALQFLGRQQLVEVYGELFPQGTEDNLMVQYNKLAMQMDADKNDTSAQADTIATEWGKLKDERQLAELMHDATRLQIDPRKEYDRGDIKTHYTELRAKYQALSPGAKAIFDKASAAYEKHYAEVKAAVHQRIERAMVGNPNRASMLARMDAEFFGKIKGIYFPLARFGDYMVQVNWRGANPRPDQGQAREAIHFAETMNEAQALRAELMKQYPPEKGFQIGQVTRRAEYNAARDSVGRGFLQQMFNMFKSTGMDPSLQDAINQLYLSSLPDLSWAKHGIHRKGTPGFSQDARRAFANHMFHGARYLAKLNYADQLTQALDDMQHYANAVGREAGYDQVKAQQVIDEMVKRHDLYMNPKTNKLSNWLTSVGFVFYLGLSPASAAVNLTQTALVAYPILGGRYGFGKAASALLAASKTAMAGHNDMSKVLKGDELRAYEGWVKSGLVDVTLAHDLAGVAAGNDNALHGAMGTVMKTASFMFHHAERFNRQATALASYRLARAKGMDHAAAYAASVQDTNAAHFDYSSGNRARVMQGDVARVVLLFKQYAQNMIYTFARNAVLAVKGDRQAAKIIAGLLTTHALAAGVLGLPVVGLLLSAASMIGGDPDDPWDAEIALRNLFADAFGDKGGEVLAHGLSRLTPWDISSRVGLNHLLLPDIQEGLEGARLAEATMTGLLGPVAGIGVNAAKGFHTIATRGDWQRGLEEMLPAFMRGPMKSLRYAQEGIKDRTGIEMLPETTLLEDAGQFLGFSPSRGREAQEGKSAVYQTDKQLQERRTQLIGNFADRVIRQQDTSEQLAAIAHFNSLHPNRQIAALHLQHSIRMRLQHKAQAKDGIFLPKSRALDARRAGAFASEDID